MSTFSLNFPAIVPSNSDEARSKVAPHGKGYDVSNSALGLLYGHGILTIYENLLL